MCIRDRLSGACCIAGAIWFATRLKSIRKLIRPIYVNLGILPGPVNAVIQDLSLIHISTAIASAVRQSIEIADPNQPVTEVRTMDDLIDASVVQRRLSMVLLAIFAAVATALAGLGIYGVMAYSVAPVSYTHLSGGAHGGRSDRDCFGGAPEHRDRRSESAGDGSTHDG